MHSIMKISFALLVVSLLSDALANPTFLLGGGSPFDLLGMGNKGGCSDGGKGVQPGPGGYGDQYVFKRWFYDWLGILQPWFRKYYGIAGNNCGSDFNNWFNTIFDCMNKLQNWCNPNGGQIAPC